MRIASGKLKKIVIAALATVVLAAVVGQLVVGYIISLPAQAMSEQSKAYEKTSRKVLELSDLQKAMQINVIQEQQYLQDVSATRGLDGLDDGFANADENATQFYKNMAAARSLAQRLGAKETLQALDEAKGAFPDYYAMGQTMAHAYVDEGPSGGNAHMAEFDAVSEKIQAAIGKTQASINATLADIDADSTAARENVDSMIKMATIVAGGVILLTATLGGLAMAMIIRKLLTPLAQTTEALNGLAAGRRDIEMKGSERKDEMGDLARAFARFKQQADEKIAVEDERGAGPRWKRSASATPRSRRPR